MNFDSSTWLAIAAAVIASVGLFFNIKGTEKKLQIRTIRENLLQLFLYAEKQDWVGPDKMAWCIKQIIVILPDNIEKIVGDAVDSWAQKVYDEFKVWIESTALEDTIVTE